MQGIAPSSSVRRTSPGHEHRSGILAQTKFYMSALASFAIPLLVGCSSGRMWSVHATDTALLVRDRAYPRMAVVTADKTTFIHADGLAPMEPSGHWAVMYAVDLTPRWIQLEPEDPTTIRLLLPALNRSLRAVNLVTGESKSIAHSFENDDSMIRSSCVQNDILAVRVGSRYSVGPGSSDFAYFAYSLPDGPWREIDDLKWRSMKESATSAVSMGNANPHKVMIDGWGEVAEVKHPPGWRTILTDQEGRRRTILSQNDWGSSDAATKAVRVLGPWP